ncbi:IS66 family insertion sequence element accessory protein TnpB [Vibrio splendidus]|uniref:IS66 family insertion sequence element accessory protein TnpB n=1 Tax=Vibrio splendidus TaxID=29497 RepID=A0AA43G1N1_VIBSP|nr:IS66 family insertion sequence element accessory protein TnpB [Vibrio splendidus]MDH5923978.1 IS66 family insertion sequence element accessory protein TnpB [Vibrio splendidus]
MAKRRTNLEWQTLFEQYESSNITQRAFCEEHGLSLSTFFAKRRQLQTANQSESVGFVRAEIVEKTTNYQTQVAMANMTLLVNDVELSIPQGTPATYLAELIGALS